MLILSLFNYNTRSQTNMDISLRATNKGQNNTLSVKKATEKWLIF